MNDLQLFDEAVRKYFFPVTADARFAIERVDDGLYRIVGGDFIVHVRMDTGHRRGLNVLIALRKDAPTVDDLGYGILNVTQFNGFRLELLDNDTEAQYFENTERLADATRRYLFPYLFGVKTDFEKIKEWVQRKIIEYRKQQNPFQ